MISYLVFTPKMLKLIRDERFYLLDYTLGRRRVARSHGKVPASTNRVSVASKVDGHNLLVVGTLEVSRRLQNVDDSTDVAVLPRP